MLFGSQVCVSAAIVRVWGFGGAIAHTVLLRLHSAVFHFVFLAHMCDGFDHRCASRPYPRNRAFALHSRLCTIDACQHLVRCRVLDNAFFKRASYLASAIQGVEWFPLGL